MRNLILSVLALCLSVASLASDIVWIRLEPEINYQDINYSCSSVGMFHAIFLAAEVQNGKFIQAKLRTSETTATDKNSIPLDAKELQTAEVTTDIRGKFWLKNLALSSRSVNWILNAHKTGFDACYPPTALKTMDPNGSTFTFTLPSEENQKTNPIFHLVAPLQVYKGDLVNGGSYRVEFQLTQKQM